MQHKLIHALIIERYAFFAIVFTQVYKEILLTNQKIN